MNDNKLKHLEFIQSIITRMAQNSFLLKGWAVTIVAGLLAFANKAEMDSTFLWAALIPVILFWILDGFFLHQERLYRKLYDNVRAKEDKDIDFSMNTSSYRGDSPSWFKTCFSTTLIILYVPIFVIILLAMWFLAK